jgi:polysaccharide deacetylase 2 family uncharacterized protein YibQ
VADELSAPLGQSKKRRRLKMPPITSTVMVAVFGFFLVVFVLWAAVMKDPMGGEPMVVIALPDLPAAAKPEAGADAKPGPEAAASGQPAAPPAAAGTQTITIIDGSSGKTQDVQVPSGNGGKAPAVDSKLLETSRHGQIPRIGLDGTKVITAYAGTAAIAPDKADRPRIAVVVGGLGISASTTAEAMAKLPAAVTFAFSPYGGDLGRLAGRARGEGHELLLQVPMEPFDYPDNDPGPQTLLTTLSPDQNVDRMQWLMSRMQGYVGVANFMGARFTATEGALAPVLRETAKRGLLFVDDGSSPRSLASQIAGANSLPFVKSDIAIDIVPTPPEIDRALVRLEATARENGAAVGVATALPVSIERLSQWAKSVGDRGFVLVPITAIVAKPKSAT